MLETYIYGAVCCCKFTSNTIMMLYSVLLVVLALHSVHADCEIHYTYQGKECYILCMDLGWNDGLHPGHEAAEKARNLKYECELDTQFYSLKFDNCSFPNQRLEGDWFTHDKTQIFEELHFIRLDLASIQDGAIAQYDAFNTSIKKLYVLSTALTEITEGMLRDVTNPYEFDLEFRNDQLLLAQRETFSDLAPKLTVLWLKNAETAEVIANITGKCQPVQLVQLETLEYNTDNGQPGLGIFSKDLFSSINSNKLLSIDFEYGGIVDFEDTSALEPFAVQTLYKVSFTANLLTNIPNGIFDPLVQLDRNIAVNVGRNPWHCDGNLQYLQDMMNDSSDKLVFDVDANVCATPASQAGKKVIDADLSGKFELRAPVPKLEITCVN